MPVMHVQVRVVADDAARDAASGEVSELWIRGPAVTPGYWNQPEATRAAFAEGGWLRTAAFRHECGENLVDGQRKAAERGACRMDAKDPRPLAMPGPIS
jgi:acyl-CoA synthetase (AMP-forming)/AMP-acid ligase II